MSEGKDIPINIKTTSDNSGTDSATESIEELKTASEEASAETSELDQNVEKIARAQRGTAIADLAGKVGKLAERFRQTANEVREYDSAAADALDQTADNLENVTSAVGTLAMAFAVGGPLGLGLTGLAIGVKALVDAYQESTVAGITGAAAQKKSLEDTAAAARAAANEAEARAEELKSQEIEDAIRRQNEALAEGLGLLEKQLKVAEKNRREKEEVLTAEDDLALANIDIKEASGTITNEEAAKQRAEVVVAAKKRTDDYRKQDALTAAALADQQATEKENFAKGAEVQALIAVEKIEQKKALAEEARRRANAQSKYEQYKNAAVALSNADDADPERKQQLDEAASKAWVEMQKTPWQENGGESAESIFQKNSEAKMAVRKAEADAAEAKTKAEAARKEAADARANAGSTRQASEGTIATVDKKAEIEASARDARETARRLTDEKKEREEAQKKADDAAKKKASDRERRTGEEAGIGKSALGLLPKGVLEEFRQSVAKAAEGLQDGDQGNEIVELSKLMNRLAQATQVKGTKTSVDIKNLAERIKKLEQQ